jgi:hypothetical protein
LCCDNLSYYIKFATVDLGNRNGRLIRSSILLKLVLPIQAAALENVYTLIWMIEKQVNPFS